MKRFHPGLFGKMALILSWVVLFQALLTLVVVVWMLGDQFSEWNTQVDKMYGRNLALQMNRQLARGVSFQDLIQQRERIIQESRIRRRPESPEEEDFRDRRHKSWKDRLDRHIPPTVITDLGGRILLTTGGPHAVGTIFRPEHPEIRGIPLGTPQKQFGLLYFGRMVAPGPSPAGQAFLRAVAFGIVLATLLSVVIALIIGALFFRQLLHPLNRLTQAAADLPRGEAPIPVPVKTRDELGQLTAQFNTMAEEIHRDRLWRRQIIADTAHEIRTPAALIAGRLEMIGAGVYSWDSDQLDQLTRDAAHLNELIRQLQELARAENPDRQLRTEPLDLAEVAEAVIKGFEPQFLEKGIRSEVRLEARAVVQANRMEISQVITNFVSNALRYGPETGCIRVTLEKRDGEIRLSVEDQGPGIPEGERDSVFKRFFRGEGSRNRASGGFGLGLAIAAAIMEKHGGAIGVEDSSLGGAEFWLTLPFSETSRTKA